MSEQDQATQYPSAQYPPAQLWAVDDDELWTLEDPTAVEDRRSVDPMAGFVSLGYVRAALRRGRLLWLTTAILGLVIGSGFFVKFPPAYQASTMVLVNDGSNVNPAVAINTDAQLAQSRTVAAQVVQQLKLPESVSTFAGSYTVVAATEQMLQINVSAAASNDAVQRAAALAADFLQFHAQYAKSQQQLLENNLNTQLSQAEKSLSSVTAQLSNAQSQPDVSQSQLNKLTAKQTAASNTLGQVQQYVVSTRASSRTNTDTIVNGSQVVDPAAVAKHSRTKAILLYVAGGLIGGLAVGMAIVVIAALVSDRLRRRDEIAAALGTPVRVSVATVPAGRRGWPARGSAERRATDLRRVVALMRTVVDEASLAPSPDLPQAPAIAGAAPVIAGAAGTEDAVLSVDEDQAATATFPVASEPVAAAAPVTLAVVAVDNARDVARIVAALAVSCAGQGKRVVLADLTDQAPAARLLGVRRSGVSEVNQHGIRLTVITPSGTDVLPIGPGQATAGLTGADVLLTMANLDPAVGAEGLATWASVAAVVVTAGNSTAARIGGVGEMLRLAGIRMVATALLKADKYDESIGSLSMAGVVPRE